MNILVTGATGFVGKALCKKLVQKNHQVFILSRAPEKYKNQLPFPATLLTHEEFETKLSNGFKLDSVINLAGENVAQRWTSTIKKTIRSSRVDTTKKLINSLQRFQGSVNSFISASAIGYYGDRANEELTEVAKPSGSFLSKVCQDWEQEALRAKEIAKRVSILRIGIVLGKNGGALEKMLLPFLNGVGGVLGNGKQWMSWIHIDDLVDMFVWCVENPSAYGVYNAVSPNPVTNKEFSECLAKAINKKLFLAVPKIALSVLYGEMSEIILASQKVIPEHFAAANFPFQWKSLDKTFNDIIEIKTPHEKKVVFEQWVPYLPDEVFPFFENEQNLEAITPEWLHFEVLNKSTARLEKGTRLNYRLKLYGIPQYWTTLIEDWKSNEYFIDTQEKGPYKKWHHTHEFERLGNGTVIKDSIVYGLHFGNMGKLAAGWKVDRDVLSIFKYRANKIKDLNFKELSNKLS